MNAKLIRRLSAFALSVAALLTLWQFSAAVHAQKTEKSKTALHTWTNTQNDGWFRIEFDRLQVPYSYISDQVIRDTTNLREKFDVIIFPPVGGSAQSIVSGIPVCGRADSVEGKRRHSEHGHGPGSE